MAPPDVGGPGAGLGGTWRKMRGPVLGKGTKLGLRDPATIQPQAHELSTSSKWTAQAGHSSADFEAGLCLLEFVPNLLPFPLLELFYVF